MSTSLTKTNELLEQLDSNSKKAIIGLIDLETERNMQAVIEQLKSFETKMELKFDNIDSKFDNIESKFDSKFDNVQSKLSTLYWLLTFLVTITTVFAGLEIFN